MVEAAADNLPIEFDLLDYRPQPWREVDCLMIESEFRWYLTGRFPVIAIPELAKRALQDPTLYRAFFTGEALDEYILPPDGYPEAATEQSSEEELKSTFQSRADRGPYVCSEVSLPHESDHNWVLRLSALIKQILRDGTKYRCSMALQQQGESWKLLV